MFSLIFVLLPFSHRFSLSFLLSFSLDTPCGVCNQELGNQSVITFRDVFYHSKCFVCEECRQPLRSVREHEGRFYCDDDFLKLFAKRYHPLRSIPPRCITS